MADDWEEGVHATRIAQAENLATAESRHKGTLDFSAWSMAHNKQGLGFQGSLYLARPYGNDSSNVQSLMNPPTYWKLQYYKGEAMLDMTKAIDAAKKAMTGKESKPHDCSGIFKIADKMRAELMTAHSPGPVKSFPPTFHSCLSDKYDMKVDGRKVKQIDGQVAKSTYKYCQGSHTSSKAELHYIASHYVRKDRDMMLNRDSTLKRKSSLQTHFPEQFK